MSKTRERIRDSQLRYKQGLGQNFIYDETLLEELVRLSGVGRRMTCWKSARAAAP